MKLIAVDDEKLQLDDFVLRLKRLSGNEAEVSGFCSADEALNFAIKNRIDAAFLDIVMPETSGLFLAKRLKEIHPDTKIIFLTAHSEYSLDAFKARASGYILKPPLDEDIVAELKYLNGEVSEAKHNRLFVQTFGNFEAFADGRPITFKRSKSKEILAYLVDRRGAAVSKKEIAAVIWEDAEYNRTKQIQLETLMLCLRSSLKNVGGEKILIRGRNSIAVNVNEFDCDYYAFCKCDAEAVNAYRGEYMSNYSWAEFTAAYLSGKVYG